MKIILLLIATLTSMSVTAQPYVEVGLGAAIANNPYHCISDSGKASDKNSRCSDNPLGSVALGYQWRDFSIVAEHKSSLREKDRGLDTVFVKYRYTFN